jgi:phosphoglycolate phosphatase-like HAD superfamily hydrolase
MECETPSIRLALFDVDGTLISTGGAGMRAFYRALRATFDIKVDNEVIRPDGKTDPVIVKELLAHFKLSGRWNDETRDAIFASYLSCLEEEMFQARERGLIRVLPGVTDLLELLSCQPDIAVGLVTGNLEEGARIKLEKAGLAGYFRFGGYGSDSEDRTTLTRIGIRRGAQAVAPRRVAGSVVIGDTPLDITHGHAAGAPVIAVASARYSMEALAVHNPDFLVPDLKQTASIIAFVRTAR